MYDTVHVDLNEKKSQRRILLGWISGSQTIFFAYQSCVLKISNNTIYIF